MPNAVRGLVIDLREATYKSLLFKGVAIEDKSISIESISLIEM